MTSPTAPAFPNRLSIAVTVDLIVVLAFVAIGRASHSEPGSLVGFLGTAWPFVAGLALGWLLARVWRQPLSVGTAAGIWAVTVVVALMLRLLSGQGVALSFAIVTAVTLGVFLIGWRALVALAIRLRRARAKQVHSQV
ncbi:MAG TPA: DUF3054 domain-containing protein [Glaciihabitans sp.]|jgi:hypothetical protein|nr:DUF3054 domain-containing protein [Glaciihabitans sp.]